MKNILLKSNLGVAVFFVGFFFACGPIQKTIDKKPSAPVFGIGKARLGMPFEEFLQHVKHDSLLKTDCLIVFRKGKAILKLSDKNYLRDRIVRMIDIYSKDLTATGSIRVGMPVAKLLKKFPDMELHTSAGENLGEYFVPQPLQTFKANGEYDICTLIYVEGTGQKRLVGSGNQRYPTKNFSTEGRVSLISIFMWGGNK